MIDPTLSAALNLSPSTTEAVLTITQSVVVCGVFFAFVRIGERTFSRLQLVSLTVCLLLAFLLISKGSDGIGGYGLKLETFREMTRPVLLELPANAEKSMPAENRYVSMLMAKNAYVYYGKITEYVRTTGERATFSPSADDINERDRLVKMEASIDVLQALASRFAFKEAVLLLVATLLGYLIGAMHRVKRKKLEKGPGSN
jgi:phosphopantetheinyl transferase (holo-ACP synthase)